MRLLAAALLAALLATPGSARADDTWGLSLQFLWGVSRYDVGGLQAGIDNQGADMLKDSASLFGGIGLLRLGMLDLGIIYEGGSISSAADSAVLTPAVGFALPLGNSLRFDLLGELGGHKISNISTSNGGVDYSQATSVWLPYVGVRPMLTLRIPMGPLKVIGSLAAVARWDLVKKDVVLDPASGAAGALPYTLGGTTFGLSVGAGLEF
jgi:hypothetical protein